MRLESALDWDAIAAAGLAHEPFDHFIASKVLRPEAAAALATEFPYVPAPGSFSLDDAPPGPVLRQVIDELLSDRFRAMMAERFGVDLTHRSTTVTLRGFCGPRDGFVHTDSRSKILSLLLYLNPGWTSPDGRLRLLRAANDLDHPAVEVPPDMGTLLAFRRSDASWHGHTPYTGVRRVLQMNYVRSEGSALISGARHRLSAIFKRTAAAG